MRIRSTDAASRSDDTGEEFLEASSRVLDWDSPGRIESFVPTATYDVTGTSATGTLAAWAAASSWPTSPILIVCENDVKLCHGDKDDTQGVVLYHQDTISSQSAPTVWLPRHHRGIVYRGGYFVLRPDGLWNVNMGEDTVTRYDGPGVTTTPASPVIHGGELLSSYAGLDLDIFQMHPYEGGEVVFVGGDDAVEILWREEGQNAWTRPWSITALRFGDISGDLSHKFYDIRIRPDGVVFALGYKTGQLALIRTSGIFDPKVASVTAPGTSSWTLTFTAFPSVFSESVANSQVGADVSTRIRPRMAFDQDGALFIMTAIGIIKVPDPLGDPDTWSLWANFEGTDLGLTVSGLSIPAGGHILDFAIDAGVPGLLQRLNYAADGSDDVWLYVCNRAFRQIAWKRRYDEVALGLRTNNARYPRSTVVYLGKTPSPLEGSGPDEEILGGTP